MHRACGTQSRQTTNEDTHTPKPTTRDSAPLQTAFALPALPTAFCLMGCVENWAKQTKTENNQLPKETNLLLGDGSSQPGGQTRLERHAV